MIIDEYIKAHGDEGLPEAAKIINDMKGLKGFWNVSDEQYKMNKEVAMMLSSMILTAGMGTVFAGIAGVSRGIAVGVR